MRKIRKRLTFANVVACLALFIALGGASYAATQLPKNSVGTKQIKKKAVKVGKLGPEAVKAGKLAKNAVTTNRIRDNAVTGAKVNETTLGKVPSAGQADVANRANTAAQADRASAADTATKAQDAATLDGRGSEAFVGGGGESLAGRALLQLAGGGKQHILDIPGYGEVVGGCGSGGAAIAFINEAGANLRVISVAGTEVAAETIGVGLRSELVPSGVGSAGQTVLQIGSTDFTDQKLLTVIVTREAQSGSKCGVQAWAVTR